MELFIQIKDGKPFEHPISKDNLCAAFPEIDINNLPASFAKFERVSPPEIGIYEVYVGVTYELVGDIYKDIHHVRNMTESEKLETDKMLAEINSKFPPIIGVTRV